MVTLDFRPEVEIWLFCTCAMNTMQYNAQNEVQKRQNLQFFATRVRQNKPIKMKFGKGRWAQNRDILSFFPAWMSLGDTADPDEIKPANVDHWPSVKCQIWPDREFAHAAGFAADGRCLRFLVMFVFKRTVIVSNFIFSCSDLLNPLF